MKKLLIIIIGLLFATTAYGQSAINFDGKSLTTQEYNAVKLELKTKVANRSIKAIQPNDGKLWIEMLSQNLKGCLIKNVTGKNWIDKLNNCL